MHPEAKGRGIAMEAPELEFLQWLLEKYIHDAGLDKGSATLADLLDALDEALTPIGGG